MPNSLVKSRMLKVSRPAAPTSKLAAKSGTAGGTLRPGGRSESSSGFMTWTAFPGRRFADPPGRHISDVYVNVKSPSEKFLTTESAARTESLGLGQSVMLAPMRYFSALPTEESTWPRLPEVERIAQELGL